MGKRNRMKVLLLILTMTILFPMSVMAAEEEQKGCIKIELEDSKGTGSKQGVVFEYTKVASYTNGQYVMLEPYRLNGIELYENQSSVTLNEMASRIAEKVSGDGKVVTNQEGQTRIEELEMGMYLIRVIDRGSYDKIDPMLIGVPLWNETTKKMDYEVTIVPKHSPEERDKIVTGDNQPYSKYIVISAISLILVVAMSCHNRFKCGKISVNYSETGGYTHGNDNDTENPRCTRWARTRGGRSID